MNPTFDVLVRQRSGWFRVWRREATFATLEDASSYAKSRAGMEWQVSQTWAIGGNARQEAAE